MAAFLAGTAPIRMCGSARLPHGPARAAARLGPGPLEPRVRAAGFTVLCRNRGRPGPRLSHPAEGGGRARIGSVNPVEGHEERRPRPEVRKHPRCASGRIGPTHDVSGHDRHGSVRKIEMAFIRQMCADNRSRLNLAFPTVEQVLVEVELLKTKNARLVVCPISGAASRRSAEWDRCRND